MQSKQKNQNKEKLIYTLSLGSQLGFLIALPLVSFLVLGLFLDKKFNRFPFFSILFIIIGIINVFIETYYFLLPFIEKKVKKNR
jgi:F0F1-type ATP synthase assembly protein I